MIGINKAIPVYWKTLITAQDFSNFELVALT